MNSDEAIAVIRRIMYDKLGVDGTEVVPGAHLRDDLGLDSLDAVDLIESMAEEVGERADTTVVARLVTVADVVTLIQRLSAAQATP